MYQCTKRDRRVQSISTIYVCRPIIGQLNIWAMLRQGRAPNTARFRRTLEDSAQSEEIRVKRIFIATTAVAVFAAQAHAMGLNPAQLQFYNEHDCPAGRDELGRTHHANDVSPSDFQEFVLACLSEERLRRKAEQAAAQREPDAQRAACCRPPPP